MALRAWLVVLLAAARAFAAEPTVETVERAMRDLRYSDARNAADVVIARGGLEPEALRTLLRLRAEASAILDGTEAGERDFRTFLVLDPDWAPAERRSPVVADPFERARAWVARNGALAATVSAPSSVRAGEKAHLEARITADPLALVAGARFWVRRGDESGFRRLPAEGLAAEVEAGGPRLLYYVELVDVHGNVLERLGSPQAARPIAVEPRATAAAAAPAIVAPAPPKDKRLLWTGLGLGIGSFAVLGAAIGLDVSASAEYQTLQRRCAPSCTDADLGSFRLQRDFAVGLYVVGAAALATGVVLMIVHGARAR